MVRLRILAASALLVVLASATARAEPLLVTADGSVVIPVNAPQSERFGVGGAAAAGVLYPVAPWMLVGGRLRAGFLSDGVAPSDPGQRDPGLGGLFNFHGALRLRLPGAHDDPRRGVGPFLGVGGGASLTGGLVRPSVEAGLGWGFQIGTVALAPVARWVAVVQTDDPLSSESAHLLLAGLEVTFLDARQQVAEPEVVVEKPSDRDGDGLADNEDGCPDDPEDHDGFQDEDGCPDSDNDGDEIVDAQDICPNEAEDYDDYEDDDGCPEPDNDEDGFLDADDQCPLEAEVVNGNKDYDGCPDEGLIVMKNDRIVLEERVLFDLERARVKRAARPVLRAIVHLYKQHPEWVRIRIEGHADKRGNAEYNLDLSERRAKNVMKTLIRLGVPSGIIESKGYGSSNPRDRREEEEAHRRNRRVEFVVETQQEAERGGAKQGAPSASDESEAAPVKSAKEPAAEGADAPPQGKASAAPAQEGTQ